MFELSVSLEYLFQDAGDDLADRVAAAAEAGFRKVEIFTTAGRDIPALAGALKDHGVEMWSVVADPRTMLVNPDTHAAFRDQFRGTAEDARELGCARVVVGSGLAVPYQKRPLQLATVTKAVASVVDIAEELDVTIMIEAVNTLYDHPGVLFSETQDSLAVVQGVDSPRVRLLYDMYHSITEGEDPAVVFPQVVGLVEHVQIADVPGRGEPGSGTLDWPRHLELLRVAGYSGVVGVECHAMRKPTAAALRYIKGLCEG